MNVPEGPQTAASPTADQSGCGQAAAAARRPEAQPASEPPGRPAGEPPGDRRTLQVAVVGPDDDACTPTDIQAALAVGAGLAQRGFTVVTGGLGGVMAASCRGAYEGGGLTVAILPGVDSAAANPWSRIVLATGLGQARNVVVAQAGFCVIAIGHSWGTVSEMALAARSGIPVVRIGETIIDGAVSLPGITRVPTASAALATVERIHRT